MCDLGLVLGMATGAAQAAGQAQASEQNKRTIRKQALLEHAAQAREFLVQSESAHKKAYDASLEADRGKAYIAAMGQGMRGNTAGLQSAEQSRQGALSIANAKDQATAATANYYSGQNATTIGAQNRINAQEVSPLTSFSTVAMAGMNNYRKFA